MRYIPTARWAGSLTSAARQSRGSLGSILQAGLLSLGCALLTSCAEGSDPLDPVTQTFSALEEDRFAPRVIVDPGPEVLKDDAARVKPVLEGFERNADEILTRGDLAQRIALIESAYMISGRYMDLLVIYQQHVAKHGAASSAAPRLVWSWLRLGQEKRAGELAAQLLKARPDDATAWFLQGAYWVRYAADDVEITRDVIMAWKKTLALDPVFIGFDEIDAPTLKAEIERMNASLKMTDAQAAERAAAHLAKLLSAAPQPPTTPPVEQPPVAAQPPVVEQPPTIPQPPVVEQPPVVAQPQAPAPLALTLARAQLAADSGQRDQAVGYLREARLRHLPGPDLVAAIQAQGAALTNADLIAFLEVSWRLEQDRPALARATREAAKRPGMTGPQLWSLALFSLRQLEDRPLTGQLLDRLEREHPEDAKRLDAAKLRAQL